MDTPSQPRGSPDTPETAPEAPRWLQGGPTCLQDGPKPVAIPRSWQASYVWEPFWGDLRMSLNHFYPIVKSLGPSAAYLGPLSQPTCSLTSLLGTLMPKLTAPKLCLTGFARPSGCRKPLFFQWFLLVLLTDIFAACYSQVNLTWTHHPSQEAPQTPPKRPRRPQDGPK